MESGLLMTVLILIILMRFILWSCFNVYLDYKLTQRYPKKRKDS
ncbi:small integral membrane protein 38 [Crotalus tigris]|nr:small integral membrane protein 38 [Crotalus tigris]XP_039217397.1 small integral membrane protein 38 [Crotalus tigris]XP_039217398.1 small integral membrane protein 38 [Crotalus tigris]